MGSSEFAKLSVISLFIISILSVPAFSVSNDYNVSMQLIFNVSGIDYSSHAYNETGDGLYRSEDISKKYSCLNTSSNLTTGIIFTGNSFNYIEMENQTTSYRIKMDQSLSGNEFIIPITQGGCMPLESRMNRSSYYLTGPFVPFSSQGAYMAALILRYRAIDIVPRRGQENFESGQTGIFLEKNESGGSVQIIAERK